MSIRVDGNSQVSCPVAGFGISSAGPLDSATMVLVFGNMTSVV